MKIHIQSYKRAGEMTSHRLFPNAFIWVHSFEAEDYQKEYGDRVRVLPDETRGNLPRVKNWLLDQFSDDDNLLIDDDISRIWFFQGKESFFNIDFDLMLERYTRICREWGLKLWGVNITTDKQAYREYTPFSITSYISSSFSCFLKENRLRYDPRLPLKEDFDMTIQQCNTYRGLLRVNRYFMIKEGATNSGGCATYRNIEVEKDQLKFLQKKWGKKIVSFDHNQKSRSHNSSKIRTFDISPIIKIPIRGI